jgi:CRISPR-associated exonuclease Cas4
LKLSELLYRWKAFEQLKHERKEGEVYVTDLLECGLKRRFEETFPEVARADYFNPATLLGDVVHAGVRELLQGMPDAQFEVEGEMEFGGLKIKGRADMLLPDRVVDFKFVRSSYRVPHNHHVLQVRIYMRMFSKPKGSLLYLATDRITEIDEDIEPSLGIPITDEELKTLLSRRDAPMWPEWECEYGCPWTSVCPRMASRGESRGERERR